MQVTVIGAVHSHVREVCGNAEYARHTGTAHNAVPHAVSFQQREDPSQRQLLNIDGRGHR